MSDLFPADQTAKDPFGTLRNALWIGGGQWADKSTITRLLAIRYGLTAYHDDYHDARAHNDRRIARRLRRGEPPDDPDPEDVWVNTTPEAMTTTTLASFPIRFTWALDGLRALVSGHPVIAEGWGLRPELVAPLLDSPRRMVVMVATDRFRQHQLRPLARARTLDTPVSDPNRAQRNRLARDRIIAADAVHSAHRLGIRVIDIDGTQSTDSIADILATHFSPYLPAQAKS